MSFNFKDSDSYREAARSTIPEHAKNNTKYNN